MRYFFLTIIGILSFAACNRGPEAPTALSSEIMEIWDDGLPRLVWLYDEVDGQKVAVKEVHYYPDGQKHMEGPLEDGRRQGEWKSWYENGNLWSMGDFVEGERHGKGVVFHSNGKKFMEGTYLHGSRFGIWQFWDRNGKKISEEEALIIISEME